MHPELPGPNTGKELPLATIAMSTELPVESTVPNQPAHFTEVAGRSDTVEPMESLEVAVRPLRTLLQQQEQPVRMNTEVLAQELGVSVRTAYRYLNFLSEEGEIRISRLRVNKGQGWINQRFIYIEKELM